MKTHLLLLLFLPFFSIAQKKDYPSLAAINWTGEGAAVKKNPLWVKSIAPIALGLTSALVYSPAIKTDIQNWVLEPFNGYHTTLDDYIQYAPIIEMYAFDALKVPARNSVWNQTKYLVMAELTTAGIVHLMKNTFKIKRPDGSAHTSFPSGHTGQAFVTSQVLFNEYYQTRPLLGISGYLFSGATGALRVINNRHWVPDVLMGAGIAILMTNIIYHFEPLKDWNPWHKNPNIQASFIPQIQNDTYGFNLKVAF
ncbi:hypothetical protein DNU06_11275 [Putridiphycobacter roseus]|uniref:Phosphatidic acid phosphatase type 2/haloperoxidase domain-containing protein n=1 Tax=Putridiphycobacter roseus TaxID=2219161 RepID=A0A2W1MZX4_9FLAO|nr:phosphatase PAP2 family protein [Putridiphycobacter roseus]PZE16830.1 hypothetical protein DNU06_11275 [Putridiphycobacter roseus]